MATKRKKRGKATKGRQRASWNGTLVFGLVSIPVEAFNAVNRDESDIHFHQLHAECHRRIQYKKVCPLHGEVTQDEIVSGYEYRPGKYVEIDPEELDTIKTKKDRALTIDTFVSPETIDPVYLDGRMYYLLPAADSAAEPYSVMVEAMSKEERYGIGNVVIFGKEQLAMVRAISGVLHMAMLNFDEEIRPPAEAKKALPPVRQISRQVTLARALIRNWFKEEFDFTKYDDQYRKRVARLIKAKVAGHEVVKPAEEEPEPDVVNLMEALKRSVAAETNGRPRKKARRRRSA
jgi:DNA end-binding protein Ku